jgi:hypothetical protein
MKKAYIVKAYSHEKNAWERYICTAHDSAEAQCLIDAYTGGRDCGWKVHAPRFLCNTPDDVMTQV